MNPQEKLKEIESRFMADQDDGQDIRWIIERVKNLEKVLVNIDLHCCHSYCDSDNEESKEAVRKALAGEE